MRLLVVLNWLFFGSVLVGAVVGRFDFGLGSPLGNGFELGGDIVSVVLVCFQIFLLNVIISCFLLTTLSGLVFFGLPVAVLCLRALMWGSLLAGATETRFFLALPTIVLEGEGYVLAAVAGVGLGLSWLVPRKAFGEETASRSIALGMAFAEAVKLYVFVVAILMIAAVVETVAIVFV